MPVAGVVRVEAVPLEEADVFGAQGLPALTRGAQELGEHVETVRLGLYAFDLAHDVRATVPESRRITSNRIRIKKYGTGSGFFLETRPIWWGMLSLRGELVVVGKSPDGDSIRFIPRTPSLLRSLAGGERVDPSADGSVQLRLDGIDAPETHYNGLAQPLAEPARAELLAWCGFSDVRWDGDQVSAATPAAIPAAVLSALVDPNGRPIVLLLVGRRAAAGRRDGDARRRRGRRTSRWRRPARPTGRSTRPPTRRSATRCSSPRSRRARRGAASGRATRAPASSCARRPRSARDGALILPKLFRRCSDYLRGGCRDAAGVAAPAARRAELARRRGDRRRRARATSATCWSRTGTRVELLADPLEILFVDEPGHLSPPDGDK